MSTKKPVKKPAKTKQDLSANPLALGNSVFIRTVTMNHLGTIIALEGDMVVLADASWVADTGARLSDFLSAGRMEGGSRAEIECAPGSVAIGRGAIVDVYHWTHALPQDSQ